MSCSGYHPRPWIESKTLNPKLSRNHKSGYPTPLLPKPQKVARCKLVSGVAAAGNQHDNPMWSTNHILAPQPLHPNSPNSHQTLGAKRMVVGHTPQIRGINAAVTGEGREVWRCDTGMSAGCAPPL